MLDVNGISPECELVCILWLQLTSTLQLKTMNSFLQVPESVLNSAVLINTPYLGKISQSRVSVWSSLNSGALVLVTASIGQ